MNLFHSLLGTIQEDKEFASIYLKAIQNYDGLPDEQRIRVSIFILRGFRAYDQIYLHKQKTVDPDFVESIDLSYFEWLTFPGIQRWWEVSKDMFEPNFRNHIDTLIERAKEQKSKREGLQELIQEIDKCRIAKENTGDKYPDKFSRA